MKRNNKKGFTIVELVIVIAVIAILSAVLIPTFGNIIEQANESARDQEARNLYTTYLAEFDYTQGTSPATEGVIIVDGYYYSVTDGQVIVEGTQTTTQITGTVIKNNAPANDGE